MFVHKYTKIELCVMFVHKYTKIELKCIMNIKNILFWEQRPGVASVVAIWYCYDSPFLEFEYLI